MRIVSGPQMAEIDRRTIETFGLDGQILMETAGRRVAQWLQNNLPQGSRVLFLCGPGNNGGDGLVAARAWHDLGGHSDIYLPLPPSGQGDAQRNLLRAQSWRLNFLEQMPSNLEVYSQVVDAIFGTGLSRNLSPQLSAQLQGLPPCLAVDMPSGIHSDSGQVLGSALQAHTTLTFGLPKLGQLLQPGASYCGQLLVESIGFPRSLLESAEWPGQWLDDQQVGRLLPARNHQTHKSNCGKILILAGSQQYPGAGILATQACLRAGAGLVFTCAPSCVLHRLPVEAIPLPYANGQDLGPDDLKPLLQHLEGMDALCVGPGLNLNPQGQQLIKQLLSQCSIPAVVDAGALQALPDKLSPRMLLTPHHGELSRLLRSKVADIERDRLNFAIRGARNFQCSLLLKGDPTLVATAGGSFFVSQEGTPVLAQGGSGDVLSGIAAALLGQGLSAAEAGACAAYLQGRAARLSGVPVGLGAEALCQLVPQAWASIFSKSSEKSRNPLSFSSYNGIITQST